MKKIAIISVLTLAVTVLAGCGIQNANQQQAVKESIKIGFVAPLTGDISGIGQGVKNATELAAAEVNAAGGINGRNLEIIYEDGKCKGPDAISAAQKLINVDKVPVIIGGICSGETMAFADLAEKSKVVVISPGSSAPAISNLGDYIFRNYPSDSNVGAFSANYVYNKLYKKKVAVLYVNNDWGVGIKEVFENSFKRLGGQILTEQTFNQDSRDLRTQLSKIKATNPDLIYFLGLTESSVVGLQQAKELGIKTLMFGGEGWEDPGFLEATKGLSDGLMYSVVYSSLTDDFKSKMKAKTGKDEVTVASPQAYDVVKIVAQIMTTVGTDSTAIKDELYKIKYAGGVSADEISFDKNGDLINANYVAKIIKNGKSEIVK